MATAWWTAQSVKAVLPLVRQQRFVYLIQDFEPLFFASSSQYALALETYELDHIPVINSQFLLDHLAAERVGRFADPGFVEAHSSSSRPSTATSSGPTYRRPRSEAPTALLRSPTERPAESVRARCRRAYSWRCSRRSSTRPSGSSSAWATRSTRLPSAPAASSSPAPWRDFAGYAEQMRESDVLLSLMLAPHPSYPPLEMAACGGPAVTTVFGPKTREKLRRDLAEHHRHRGHDRGHRTGASPMPSTASTTLSRPARRLDTRTPRHLGRGVRVRASRARMNASTRWCRMPPALPDDSLGGPPRPLREVARPENRRPKRRVPGTRPR